jgi:hypothetical protein
MMLSFLSMPWDMSKVDFHGIDRGEECSGSCDSRTRSYSLGEYWIFLLE